MSKDHLRAQVASSLGLRPIEDSKSSSSFSTAEPADSRKLSPLRNHNLKHSSLSSFDRGVSQFSPRPVQKNAQIFSTELPASFTISPQPGVNNFENVPSRKFGHTQLTSPLASVASAGEQSLQTASNMYPSSGFMGQSGNPVNQAQAQVPSYNLQAPQFVYQMQQPAVAQNSLSGGMFYNPGYYQTNQPQSMQFMNSLQVPTNAPLPGSLNTASTLQRVNVGQSLMGGAPSLNQYQQPSFSSFSTMGSLNPATGGLVGLQPTQSLVNAVGQSLETDADWRFRRSKEMFDQAQRSHQLHRTSQDAFYKTQTHNPSTFAFNQPASMLNSSTASALQQATSLGKPPAPFYDQPSLSVVYNSPSINTSRVNPAAQPSILDSYHNPLRPPPTVGGNSRQNWAKYRSRSFDQEDLLSSNHPLLGPHASMLTSSHLASNQDVMLGSDASSAAAGTGYAIPVDLAYKLHASHQPIDSMGNSRNVHDIPDLHANHGSHELQRNKSVSFDIPSQMDPLLDFEEASKLAQMFPDCAECQKLEQDKLLYRQVARLRKNNSDKSLHEYMRSGTAVSGIDSRWSQSNPVEERRLKDLAQLISETFSERLLQEERERERDVILGSTSAKAASVIGRRGGVLDAELSGGSLYTPVGQKITPPRGASKWNYPMSELYEDSSLLSNYSSILRSTGKRKPSAFREDYDQLPSYKDSSQYLNLEGLSMRARNGGTSRSFGTPGRTARELASGGYLGGGPAANLFGGPGGTLGRHSAYASDMDSYLYDRERYGSVNLARLNDTPFPPAASRAPHSHAQEGPDRRRNLKDIRYSRDYEFIPRSEEMNSGGNRRGTKGSLSPTIAEHYSNDLSPRRHSPRHSRKNDLPNVMYARNQSMNRKGRSNSARDDPEMGLFARTDEANSHLEYMDNHGQNSSSSRYNRHSTRRRHGNSSSTSTHHHVQPSQYNFGEERDPYRRGSSSDSMDRLSSPERPGHGRYSRRIHGQNGSGGGVGLSDFRPGYEDKVPPRRSMGPPNDSRQAAVRGNSYGNGPGDAHMGSRGNMGQTPSGAGGFSVVNGADRQKLSEVPPNHSTESGYSSQSQAPGAFNRGDRDDRAMPPSQMGGPQARMRPVPHPGENPSYNTGHTAHMGRPDGDSMSGMRMKDR